MWCRQASDKPDATARDRAAQGMAPCQLHPGCSAGPGPSAHRARSARGGRVLHRTVVRHAGRQPDHGGPALAGSGRAYRRPGRTVRRGQIDAARPAAALPRCRRRALHPRRHRSAGLRAGIAGALFAIVQQDNVLFNDTIYHNIACGRPGATRDGVEHADRRAHIHDAILALEGGQGYDTLVGDRGSRLSANSSPSRHG